MRAFLGLIRLDGTPIEPDRLTLPLRALETHSDSNGISSLGKYCGFAWIPLPGSNSYTEVPRRMADGSWLIGKLRIDNREELRGSLSLGSPKGADVDEDLIEAAFLRWGRDCCRKILGDWVFAVWNPRDRQLFLARDQYGISSLYYSVQDDFVIFSSSLKPLLTIPEISGRLDESYLAELLLGWPTLQGERTVYSEVRRLPPGHILEIGLGRIASTCYWSPSIHADTDSPNTLEEAVEGFREVWDEAVNWRLETSGMVASTLSAGLDSAAVTATAAHLLEAKGFGPNSLKAYTAVPAFQTVDAPDRITNEWDLAARTAARFRVVDHRAVESRSSSPIEGVLHSLWVHDSPVYAASNAFWGADLYRTVVENGSQVLLLGHEGNTTVSWHGRHRPKHKRRLSVGSPRTWMSSTASAVRRGLSRRQRILFERALIAVQGWDHRVLNPELVRRLGLPGPLLDDPLHPIHRSFLGPAEFRLYNLRPGRTINGALLAARGIAAGIEVRDPTSDVRVIEYCLKIPDRLLIDPETGMERMLIRAAMKGLLPEEVRLNQRKGLQAADLATRLRREAGKVDACLAYLERGEASNYLDLAYLRHAWTTIRKEALTAAHHRTSVHLLRAIMTGLFIQQPSYPRPRTLDENLRS